MFIKKVFFTAMKRFGCSVLGVNSLKCVSMNNKECKIITKTIYIKSNEPIFYPYSIKIDKCSGSRNSINDLYPKLWVPDIFKNIGVKVFNLISRTIEARHIEWHETCKCQCRLDVSVCNNKQRQNEDK